MNTLKKRVGIMLVLVLGMLACGVASATVVMNFDQLNRGGEYVDHYYDGGCGTSLFGVGPVTCGGPDYGVVWSNAVAGGAPIGFWADKANEPSDPNVMGRSPFVGEHLIMNTASGFNTGFSFYYAAPYSAANVTVYAGPNGTGSILATLAMSVNGHSCDGYSQYYSCWSSIGVNFLGTAHSVDFAGDAARDFVFDDVTLGSATPGAIVPEPAALGMFGLGLLLIGGYAGLRRRMS